MKKLWEKLPKVIREGLKAMIYIIATAIAMWAQSCQTTHQVSQSAVSEVTTRGDTTITTTTIKYEQVGKASK